MGGFSGLLEKVPAADFHWSGIARPEFIVLWFLALTFNTIFAQNSMEMSAKYLMARSDAHARKMALFPLIDATSSDRYCGFCRRWWLPWSIQAVWDIFCPRSVTPKKGAFLVTAHDVLPAGMLGLLIAGIFGATLSYLDMRLCEPSRPASSCGIFYLPVINPQCPEKKLLIISKCCTAWLLVFFDYQDRTDHQPAADGGVV